jgi:hypothetical protein
MNWIPRNSLYNLWHLRYEIANPPIFVEFVLLFIKSSTKFFLDHCLYFFNWQLHCLFFFDIRLLISALASSLFCYVLSVNVTCYVLSVNAIYSVLFVKCELFCPVCKCSLLCSVCRCNLLCSVCKCNLFCYVNINVIFCWSIFCRSLLSFCRFSFGHCIVCPSLIYGFWLSIDISKLFLLCSVCKIKLVMFCL